MLSTISALITGHSVLNDLNEIFHALNNTGVSLPICHSCEPIYQNPYFKILHVKPTIVGSKLQSLNLFQMDPGVY